MLEGEEWGSIISTDNCNANTVCLPMKPPITEDASDLSKLRHITSGVVRLVDIFLPSKDPERQQPLVNFLMKIMASRIASHHVGDDHSMADRIKKQLLRDHKSSDKALEFGQLFNVLLQQRSIQHLRAILHLLSSISVPILKDNDQNASNVVEFSFSTLGVAPSKPNDILASKYVAKGADHSPVPEPIREKKLKILDNNVALEVTEGALVRDLIFTFQGINGTYIKFDPILGTFLPDSKAGISHPYRNMILKLAEMGNLYKRIQVQLQLQSKSTAQGLTAEAFFATIDKELHEYFRLIAVLEGQLTGILQDKENSILSSGLSLKRLYVWTRDPILKLRLICSLVDGCKGLRGTDILNYIYNFMNNGDPSVNTLIKMILSEISKPLYNFLNRWLYEGELDDPWQEFFIQVKNDANPDDMWHQRFHFNKALIPKFIEKSLCKKIFLTGKSIHFTRFICKERYTLPSTSYKQDIHTAFDFNARDGGLSQSIEGCFIASNKLLMKILMSKHKLFDHLRAMKRYLLLSEGDFVQSLIEALWNDLGQQDAPIYRHNLSCALETVIRTSNVRFDDPDILDRLDVKVNLSRDKELAWDTFSLHYHVDGPASAILSEKMMAHYGNIFRFLWKLKRAECALSFSWSRQMHHIQLQKKIPEIAPELHRCHLLCNEMVHFICQLQYYMQFEVIECAWDKFVTTIQDDTLDLDRFEREHFVYIATLLQKALLSSETMKLSSENQMLQTSLHKLLEGIFTFTAAQESLYRFSEEVMEMNESQKPSGLPTDKMFTLDAMSAKLAQIADTFQEEVKSFLKLLQGHEDNELKSLGLRLNFNEFYSVS